MSSETNTVNKTILKEMALNGQTPECRALLVLAGAEPNGIIFQYDSQSGKLSSVSYDIDLFAEWFVIWLCGILPQFLFCFV